MKQLSLAANVVSPGLLDDIGDVLGRYFTNSLRAGTYEVRTNAPMGPDGELYLSTLWSASGDKHIMPLRNSDGTIRGHTSYAVVNAKPLWILCRAKGPLDQAKVYDDQWSKVEDLPPYRGWPDACYFTEIVVPIGKPAIGFLNLEFREALDCNEIAKDELQEVAGTIANFCGPHENYQRQNHQYQECHTQRELSNSAEPTAETETIFCVLEASGCGSGGEHKGHFGGILSIYFDCFLGRTTRLGKCKCANNELC
jgi:hypothetical protein